MSPSAMRLRTFGQLALLGESSNVLLAPGKPLALLAYLACAPRRHSDRTRLVDLFWGDRTEESGRHALRTTLWELRRRLGHDVLFTAADVVELSANVQVDRDAFL